MNPKYVTDGCRQDAYYLMLYCDSLYCRVNTFEHFEDGLCPVCKVHGIEARR